MDLNDERIIQAVRNTRILKAPRQSLYTFGTTNIYYYLLTKPASSDLVKDRPETVIREGRIIVEKPKLVTPFYLSRLEGFSLQAKRYFDMLLSAYGSNAPGLMYTYRNEPHQLSIITDGLMAVVDRINSEIEKSRDPLTSIIQGEDDLWDVSLLKFIYETTRSSVPHNLSQLGSRGLLGVDAEGIPAEARLNIDELFQRVGEGKSEPGELKSELDRWDLFEEYQDRFFAIFRKGNA